MEWLVNVKDLASNLTFEASASVLDPHGIALRCRSVQIQKLVGGNQDLTETLPSREVRVGLSELLFQVACVSERGIDLVRLRPPR